MSVCIERLNVVFSEVFPSMFGVHTQAGSLPAGFRNLLGVIYTLDRTLVACKTLHTFLYLSLFGQLCLFSWLPVCTYKPFVLVGYYMVVGFFLHPVSWVSPACPALSVFLQFLVLFYRLTLCITVEIKK